MFRGYAYNELSDKCQQPNVACEEGCFAIFLCLGTVGTFIVPSPISQPSL